MKNMNSTAFGAMLALAATLADARSYGSLLAPRAYQYSRPRDPFDLVSEFFQTPFYSNMNSLFKQQQQQQQQAVVDRMAHFTSPRYAVSETDGVVQLEVELPGVHAKDLSVELEDGHHLRIQGSRRMDGLSSESSFDLSFALADGVDPDQLTVKLSAGILRVQVPKKEKDVKKIEITTDDTENDEMLQIKASQHGGKAAGFDEEVDGITITEDAAEK